MAINTTSYTIYCGTANYTQTMDSIKAALESITGVVEVSRGATTQKFRFGTSPHCFIATYSGGEDRQLVAWKMTKIDESSTLWDMSNQQSSGNAPKLINVYYLLGPALCFIYMFGMIPICFMQDTNDVWWTNCLSSSRTAYPSSSDTAHAWSGVFYEKLDVNDSYILVPARVVDPVTSKYVQYPFKTVYYTKALPQNNTFFTFSDTKAGWYSSDYAQVLYMES